MMQVEVIFFAIYEVGRNIDLKKAQQLIPASPTPATIKSKDSPDTHEAVSLPRPILYNILKENFDSKILNHKLNSIQLQARLYEDGVISMIARVFSNDIELDHLDTIHLMKFEIQNQKFDVDSLMEDHFKNLIREIQSAILIEPYIFTEYPKETYTAFCITDPIENVEEFIKNHRKSFAGLLIDENQHLDLHESQVETTLSHPFSYLHNDIVILDIDRCLIIDPHRDYEEILLMCELANYQLLELSSLDNILNRYLDEAEDMFMGKKKNTAELANALKKIQNFRVDVLFILENLENFSKIIGDYFLGQIYKHLCTLFNTEDWLKAVQTHLELLENLYQSIKEERNEHTILIIEWFAIIFFFIEVIYSTLDFFGLHK